LLVGLVGDVYGIGKGSILSPLLVARGLPAAEITPTILTSTARTLGRPHGNRRGARHGVTPEASASTRAD